MPCIFKEFYGRILSHIITVCTTPQLFTPVHKEIRLTLLELFIHQKECISIESIQKVVADNYQISVSDLKGKKRDKKFTVPRQIALFIAKEITEYTYSELGIEFGGRDHSTVMHSCDKIKELMTTDPTLNSKIKLLKVLIKGTKILSILF